MKHFDVASDIEIVQELLGLSVSELAEQIGIAERSVYGWKTNAEQISHKNLEKIYDFAYSKNIRLNKIKAQYSREECAAGHKVLFHGSKTYIDGTLSVEKAKDGKALLLHDLPADVTDISCIRGEMTAQVYGANIPSLLAEAGIRPYVIAAMIILAKSEDPKAAFKTIAEKATKRYF